MARVAVSGVLAPAGRGRQTAGRLATRSRSPASAHSGERGRLLKESEEYDVPTEFTDAHGCHTVESGGIP